MYAQLFSEKGKSKPTPFDIRIDDASWIDKLQGAKQDIYQQTEKYKSTLPNYTYLITEQDENIYEQLEKGSFNRHAISLAELEKIKKEMKKGAILPRVINEKFNIHQEKLNKYLDEKMRLEQDINLAPTTTLVQRKRKIELMNKYDSIVANFSDIKADYDRERFFVDVEEIEEEKTTADTQLAKLKTYSKLSTDPRFKTIDEEIAHVKKEHHKIRTFLSKIEPPIKHPFILQDFQVADVGHLTPLDDVRLDASVKVRGETGHLVKQKYSSKLDKELFNIFVKEITVSLNKINDWNLKLNKINQIRQYDLKLIKDERLKKNLSKFLQAQESSATRLGFMDMYKFQNAGATSTYLPKIGAMRHTIKKYEQGPHHRQTIAMLMSVYKGLEALEDGSKVVDVQMLNKYIKKINKRNIWDADLGAKFPYIKSIKGNVNIAKGNVRHILDMVEARLHHGGGEYTYLVYDKNNMNKTHDARSIELRGHRPKQIIKRPSLHHTNTLTAHDKIGESNIGKGVEYYLHKNDTEFYINRSINKHELHILSKSIKRQAESLKGSVLYIKIGNKAHRLMKINENTSIHIIINKILPYISSKETIHLYLHSNNKHIHYKDYGGFLMHSIIANNDKLRNNFI